MRVYRKLSEKPAIGVAMPSLVAGRIDADFYQPAFVENEACLESCGLFLKRLGEMWVSANYGSLPDSADYTEEQGISLIRGTDISGFTVAPEDQLVKVPEEYWEKYVKARVSEGEIVMLVKGASIDRPDSAAIVPKLSNRAIINGSVFRIQLKEEHDSGFVTAFMFSSYFLKQKRRAVTNTGALYNDLEAIKGYVIPCPHPAVQAYIGDKVRLANQCRRRSTELAADIERVMEGIFGIPSSLTASKVGWVTPATAIEGRLDAKYYRPDYVWADRLIREYSHGSRLLRHRVADIANGVEYRDFVPEGRPYLTVSDIRGGRLDCATAPRIPWAACIADRGRVFENDVVVVRTGSIGQAAWVRRPDREAVISSHFIRLRLHDPAEAPWVAWFLGSWMGRLLQERVSYGLIQPQIGQEMLLGLPVPNIDERLVHNLSLKWAQHHDLVDRAMQLVDTAKSDVEALIEGRLDTEGIVAGRVKAPTWEQVAREMEAGVGGA